MTFRWTTPKQIVKFLSNTSAVTASPSEDSAIDDSKPPSPIPLSITTQVSGTKESNSEESLQTTTETTQASEENLISSVEVSRNTTTVSPLRDSVVTISQKRHRPNENVLEIAPNDNDINDHNEFPRPVKKRKKRCNWQKHVADNLEERLDEINWEISRIDELVEEAKEDENDPLHGYTFEQIKEKRKNLLKQKRREEGSA